jgi:hypothetical protein
MAAIDHVHPKTTHTHSHHHRLRRPNGRPGTYYWHTHEHVHESLAHAHALDVMQEYDLHPGQPHSHAHGRPSDARIMALSVNYF